MARLAILIGCALQAVGAVCVTLVLFSLPPLSTVAGSWVRAVNPVAGLLHVQATLNGAHGALIATAAIELGVFDALAAPPRAAPTTAVPVVDELSWVPWPAVWPSCDLGRILRLRELLFNVTSGFHDAASIAAGLGLRADDTIDLLDALATLGLVEVGGLEGHGSMNPTYRTTIAAALFIAGPNSLGRMARVSNHAHVLQRLGALPETLLRRGGEAERLVPSDDDARLFYGDTGNLWDIYASESSGFNRDVAKRAAEHIAFATPSERVTVIDIGAGSGEYTDAVVSQTGAGKTHGILVDLPGPLDVLAARDARTLVRGSFFDNATVDAACVAAGRSLENAARADVVIMLNSFAQHFELGLVRAQVVRLASCIVDDRLRQRPAEVGSQLLRLRFAVTELVRPDGPFSEWREPVPVGRQFHLVLRSLAPAGEVRRASAYEDFMRLMTTDVRRNVSAILKSPEAENRIDVVTASLFPMPARVFTSSMEVPI